MGTVAVEETERQDHGLTKPYRNRYTHHMREIQLTPAVGGWVYADWGDDKAWVRFSKDKSGRLARITELHLFEPSPERLRRVPLKRIHAAVNMRGADFIRLMLAMGIEEEPPPGMLTRQPPDSGMKLERRYRLKRPAARRLDDSFYADVAHAYQSAVAFGLNPRKAIVEDTAAADATVAGWVLEARRRGRLPSAKPGKVSA
jgi:hypothetical protein